MPTHTESFKQEEQEVLLHRSNSEEKIGLTLCYGSVDIEETDIYVSEIEPYSIAAQDGRIREGDQILQINGVDVHSREQAIKLFSQNRSDITLLLARPMQMDDGFMEEQHMMLDDFNMSMLEANHHQNMEFTSAMLGQRHHDNDEEGGTTDTATTENSQKHEKDSGVGRTDESTRNDESSEQEIFDSECMSPATKTKFRGGQLGNGELQYSNDSFTSNDTHDNDFPANEIPAEECEKFREVLENRCTQNSHPNMASSGAPLTSNSRKDSQSSIERELAILNQEMEEIQLECQQIVAAHLQHQHKVQNQIRTLQTSEMCRSPRLVPRMGTRMESLRYNQNTSEQQQSDPAIWIRQDISSSPTPVKVSNKDTSKNVEKEKKIVEDCEKDTSNSSAYNTGESCRSTPLTLELMKEEGFRGSMLSLSHAPQTVSQPQSDSEKTTQTTPQHMPKPASDKSNKGKSLAQTKSATSSSISDGQQTAIENRDGPSMNDSESMTDIYAKYSDIMYTNHAHLEHTIAVQQRLFEQKVEERNRLLSSNQSISQNSQNSGEKNTQNAPSSSQSASGSKRAETPVTSDNQMEWVVKKRADGSRYITRRPVRSMRLKERAKKITEERCGMTTDDDAMSEMKVGRYWNKEERRRHLARAREHKHKKESMIKQRMETLKEGEECKQMNIVELSHRKMMRHKGRRMLDDFTTVQEILVHGSKVTDGKSYSPLLSVTTV
ncbi:E3 ubiquitin-protein ligase PDZRN3-like [Lingula anatina]|uniref:E3 ubiquitin-protein ligase PDZRN3-like n=1 Tax=Lingula anatina TaxID=7574 RepID=A0A1S3IDR5_LINAN|nr:E3 ubiquitin-protein ligase PDZRN3-like [Lingula anatina]|eukprot:XP_013396377.1 E3 ubiquitin-protein ligase PDZRN3-like [Lingula anatina]